MCETLRKFWLQTLLRKTFGGIRDNIKIDLREMCCGDVDWIELDQGGVQCGTSVNTVMNIRIP
jgi:hypothetical protein